MAAPLELAGGAELDAGSETDCPLDDEGADTDNVPLDTGLVRDGIGVKDGTEVGTGVKDGMGKLAVGNSELRADGMADDPGIMGDTG